MSQTQWSVGLFVGSSANRDTRWTDVTTANPIPAVMTEIVNSLKDLVWSRTEPAKPYQYVFYVTFEDGNNSWMSQVSLDTNP